MDLAAESNEARGYAHGVNRRPSQEALVSKNSNEGGIDFDDDAQRRVAHAHGDESESGGAPLAGEAGIKHRAGGVSGANDNEGQGDGISPESRMKARGRDTTRMFNRVGERMMEIPSLQQRKYTQNPSLTKDELRLGEDSVMKSQFNSYKKCIWRSSRRSSRSDLNLTEQPGKKGASGSHTVDSIFFQSSFLLRVVLTPFQWLAKAWYMVYIIDLAIALVYLIFKTPLGSMIFDQSNTPIYNFDREFFVSVIGSCFAIIVLITFLHLIVVCSDLSIFDESFALWVPYEVELHLEEKIRQPSPGTAENALSIRDADALAYDRREAQYPYVCEFDDLLRSSSRYVLGFLIFWSIIWGADIYLFLTRTHSIYLLEPILSVAVFIILLFVDIAGFWLICIIPVLLRKNLYLYLCEWAKIMRTAYSTTDLSLEDRESEDLSKARLLAIVLSLRVKEDNIINVNWEFNRTCGFYLSMFFGGNGLWIFSAIIQVFAMLKSLDADDVQGAFLLFWLMGTLIAVSCAMIYALCKMASVVETYRKMSCDIFRGPPCWERSKVLGDDPLLLQTYMNELEPVLAFKLLGVPISNDTTFSLASSIIVGLMFLTVLPLMGIDG